MAPEPARRKTAARAESGDGNFLSSRPAIFLAALVIALATAVSYRASLDAPFVFDDLAAVENNLSLRHLWPLRNVLTPPANGGSVVGRPLVNLSLAANYAWGGLNVRGYHGFNLAVHILAGLALLGVVRRTLLRPALAARFGNHAALPLAFGAALLWTLHPLQTEPVICVVHRTELLVGLFYLLTIYALIRSADSMRPLLWQSLAVTACILGMTSKEVMVSAPLIALLYDRTFLAGSFREAWRQRSRMYIGLAACWSTLALLVQSASQRNGTAGFDLGVSAWHYALTQVRAIPHYLQLSLWPDPLVLDYGTAVVKNPGEVFLPALMLAALLGGTVFALVRRPVFGFIGAWFFAILAPSSSVLPIVTQTVAERRMYLPLAAVTVLAVAGLHALLGRRAVFASLALAVVLAIATQRRTEEYRSAIAIWSDTVAKMPRNLRAHLNLGDALMKVGRTDEALAHYEEAVRLDPNSANTHYNYANALRAAGRWEESFKHYERALGLSPNFSAAHNNWGNALLRLGRFDEAQKHYEAALQLKPDLVEAHTNLGRILFRNGRAAEALGHYETALQLQPNLAAVHQNLANALAELGRVAEAMPHYEAAARLQPDNADILFNWGTALIDAGRAREAIPLLERSFQLRPADAETSARLDEARRLDAQRRR